MRHDLRHGTARASFPGMQTQFVVTKYQGQAAGPSHVELERRECATWDAAAAVAVELGAIPGTGEALACAFETSRAGVWVAIDEA